MTMRILWLFSARAQKRRNVRRQRERERVSDAILPPRALDRRLQEDWARDAREGPRVLMSLRVDFRPRG